MTQRRTGVTRRRYALVHTFSKRCTGAPCLYDLKYKTSTIPTCFKTYKTTIDPVGFSLRAMHAPPPPLHRRSASHLLRQHLTLNHHCSPQVVPLHHTSRPFSSSIPLLTRAINFEIFFCPSLGFKALFSIIPSCLILESLPINLESMGILCL